MDIDIKNLITKKNIGFYCNDILLANGKFATILLILTYAKVLLQSNDSNKVKYFTPWNSWWLQKKANATLK